MQSTGAYWKPVWNILAEQFEVFAVERADIKAVPGRKTAQKGGERIARIAAREFRAPAPNLCSQQHPASFLQNRG
jgi:hypothetical protein